MRETAVSSLLIQARKVPPAPMPFEVIAEGQARPTNPPATNRPHRTEYLGVVLRAIQLHRRGPDHVEIEGRILCRAETNSNVLATQPWQTHPSFPIGANDSAPRLVFHEEDTADEKQCWVEQLIQTLLAHIVGQPLPKSAIYDHAHMPITLAAMCQPVEPVLPDSFRQPDEFALASYIAPRETPLSYPKGYLF